MLNKLDAGKKFYNGFTKYFAKVLYLYFEQYGLPPEIAIDWIIEDDVRVKRCVLDYYIDGDSESLKLDDAVLLVNSMNKKQVEHIKSILTSSELYSL